MTLPDPTDPTPDDLPENLSAPCASDQAVSDDVASDTSAANGTAPPAAAQPAGGNSADSDSDKAGNTTPLPPELGGQKGPEPTRYGDWEKGGRCTDF